MRETSDIRKTLKPKKTHSINSPRVAVHYIIPAHTPKVRLVNWHAFFSSLPVIIALVIGVGVGSAMVWQSKFGEANREPDPAVATVVTEAGEQWALPLEFDQSQLEIVSDLLPLLVEENRHEPTPEEVKNAERKEALRKYFLPHKSPFGNNDETIQAFLDSKNMKLMIAISFVESTMGKKCYYNNCSGIGGYPPNLRKYKNHAEWVRDFDSLLERRYKGVPIEKFMGLYVQPGSPNWINGVKQILAELKKKNIE